MGPRFMWGTVVQILSGSIGIVLLAFVCFRLEFNLATTMCLFLIVIVLLSLWGHFVSSAVVSLIAVVCLMYYFAPPRFSWQINDPFEGIAATIFLIISAGLITLGYATRQ